MDRRPIVAIAIAFIVGIVIQYYLRLPMVIILGSIAIVILSMLLLVFRKSRLIVYAFILGIVLFGALDLEYDYITEEPIKTFIEKDVEIIGDCMQKDVTDKSTYILEIDEIIYEGKRFAVKDKTLLRIFKYEGASLHDKKIKVKGSLENPDTARNPRMFDYNLYLRTSGIHTLLNTKAANIKVIRNSDLPLLIKLRHRLKSYIYNGTFNEFPGLYGKVALSITFGDKKILDEDLYESFKASGTAHALAVSGLHFGILFLFIDSILKLFKIKEKFKIIILLWIIWSFAFIVGFTPSVIRASSMITLFSVSNLLDRRYDLFSSLAFISLTNIVINPFIIFNISFQLSFLAVISIGLFYKPIYNKLEKLPDFLQKVLATTLAAQIGTAPLMAYHFNIFSPVAVILNIPVVFLVGIVLPVSLVFFVTLFINGNIAGVIAMADKILIKTLVGINSLSSYLPFSKFNVASPSLLYILIFYIALILIFYKEKVPCIKKVKIKDIVILILLITIVINSYNLIFPRRLKITFIDVGQGDGMLIETPRGRNVLVDGGKEQGEFLSKFLLKNGVSYVDLICISHIHSDHIGGLVDVLENIRTGSVVIGTKSYESEEWQKVEDICFEKGIDVKEFDRGKSITLEKGLTMTSLHPGSEIMKNTNDDANNNSEVLLLEYKDFEVLLTGDIEAEAEKEIMAKSNKVDIDVLKVGHHGSKTSSSEEFIDYFSPEIAVIQVGKNFYGHPHDETLDKLNERGIKTYRNDENGAVIIETDGVDIDVKTMIQ